MPIAKKQTVQDDVLTMARSRLNYIFDRFDKVVVGFSGGKDSTCCLNLTLEVAAYRKRLPLDVYFFDEEAVAPETIEYVGRVAKRPDITFRWICGPIKHRNACSTVQPWWYCWSPEDRRLWVRDFPQECTDYDERFRAIDTPNFMGAIYGPECGNVANVVGLRTQESLNRYRMVAGGNNSREPFLTPTIYPHIRNASVIYDWTSDDVWLAPWRLGWDYNRAYDLLAAMGVPTHAQRVAPPFGEQPIRGLSQWRICWPQLWDKMLARVPGADTALRYSTTELYGRGAAATKPDDLCWKDVALQHLTRLTGDDQRECATNLTTMIDYHERYSPEPIPDETPDPRSGLCWSDIAMVAMRGDLKNSRSTHCMIGAAMKRAGVIKETPRLK